MRSVDWLSYDAAVCVWTAADCAKCRPVTSQSSWLQWLLSRVWWHAARRNPHLPWHSAYQLIQHRLRRTYVPIGSTLCSLVLGGGMSVNCTAGLIICSVAIHGLDNYNSCSVTVYVCMCLCVSGHAYSRIFQPIFTKLEDVVLCWIDHDKYYTINDAFRAF